MFGLALLCLLSVQVAAEDFGVDVTFPIHYDNRHVKHKYARDRYSKYMEGCYKRYSRQECDETETQRLKMDREQPASQHNYTELGFKKVKAPKAAWEPLINFYRANKHKTHEEDWGRGNSYTNHWSSETRMLSVEEPEDGGSYALKKQIWDGVRPVLEEWCGYELYETSMYGIRTYTRGSMLATRKRFICFISYSHLFD